MFVKDYFRLPNHTPRMLLAGKVVPPCLVFHTYTYKIMSNQVKLSAIAARKTFNDLDTYLGAQRFREVRAAITGNAFVQGTIVDRVGAFVDARADSKGKRSLDDFQSRVDFDKPGKIYARKYTCLSRLSEQDPWRPDATRDIIVTDFTENPVAPDRNTLFLPTWFTVVAPDEELIP